MESGRFCIISLDDCDDAAALMRQKACLRLVNRHARRVLDARKAAPRLARPPKITFLSDTCPKACAVGRDWDE
ncbi:hypothetical protein C7G42_13640 [Bradyrhizobium sp. MOS003]|nr:hypothetical protein C7G42_13640 [Bradyrhizobium sp. MOS003]